MRKIVTRNRIIAQRHQDFKQKRKKKLTQVISSFIDYETRKYGFLSTKKLHFEILNTFNESIGLTRIKKERKSLSTQ